MTEEVMKVVSKLAGCKLEYRLVRKDLRGTVARQHGRKLNTVTDALVEYDLSTNTVTVDRAVTATYSHWVALHEEICNGFYKHLAPRGLNEEERCFSVDKMLVEHMEDDEKVPYIEKRIEMFETLLELGLTPKSMVPAFEYSLEHLRELKNEL